MHAILRGYKCFYINNASQSQATSNVSSALCQHPSTPIDFPYVQLRKFFSDCSLWHATRVCQPVSSR
eukprot:6012363-Amphidinium_carterae.1